MILHLFTVRSPGFYQQTYRTIESDDIQSLVDKGREWEKEGDRLGLKQHYTIRLSDKDRVDSGRVK